MHTAQVAYANICIGKGIGLRYKELSTVSEFLVDATSQSHGVQILPEQLAHRFLWVFFFSAYDWRATPQKIFLKKALFHFIDLKYADKKLL